MPLSTTNAATFGTEVSSEHRELLAGLIATPKRLATKWLYDTCGSALYTAIAQQPEYYIDEAEREIVAQHGGDIAARARPRTLVDLGAGSAGKTRLLLDALSAVGSLDRYVPVDVSDTSFRDMTRNLRAVYPELDIQPRTADFSSPLGLDPQTASVLFAFFGATYGNFRPAERQRFLAALRSQMRRGDGLLLGTDLVKDEATLKAAYDDRAGVTAAFVRNGLTVLNRELGANFRLRDFDHDVTWNPYLSRIENALRARRSHTVTLALLDRAVPFATGERLHVGISVKFRQKDVRSELAQAGLRLDRWWTDSASRYAVSLAMTA
ncbi:L-histidine N(alpha)-methyltransferase [Streptomyces sp. UNOB3_S3]|uniref:L-histidine N(alpha)-methyltransferase n=1 Tax=Streptomyces sp. UNOB3_S3 TaxID=2871682 RepID=UPI001E376431|nr:L-histidine N(alpha)-methyltransferase [Streptomyces sp. UNOB3_S3]MCC3773346.1 L-histidine N(alpha)-methyltransferase [Streptomyces sp. UNOB3_S3]